MKKGIYLLISLLFFACNSTKKTTENELPEGAVKIANEELEYEIIIIDPGFDTYLYSVARPANFYSIDYYERNNARYVNEWNIRHRNPRQFDPNIYENEIIYNPRIRYGLDVNYKLFNYFKFVETRYNQKFF